MTQPDPNVQAQPVQPVQQPGGDLPTVGTHDTEVQGTFNNAGQPTEDGSAPQVPSDVSDPNYSGFVNVTYTGSEVYEQDGVSFSPNETKTVNAETARTLLGNGQFQV